MTLNALDESRMSNEKYFKAMAASRQQMHFAPVFCERDRQLSILLLFKLRDVSRNRGRLATRLVISKLHTAAQTPNTMTPGTSRSLESTDSRNFCDVIFQVLLAAFGVQSAYSCRRWVRYASASLTFFSLILVIFAGTSHFYEIICAEDPSPKSLSDLVAILSLISFVAMSTYSIFSLRMKGKEIEPLLRRNGRSYREGVLFLIYCFQCIIRDVLNVALHKTISSVLESVGFAIMELAMVMITTIYYDIVQDLLGRLRQLQTFSQRTSLSWKSLTAGKWEIRKRVDSINSLFAVLLSSFYLHVFLLAASVWARVIKSSFRSDEVFISSLNFFCYILQLFTLARKSSEKRALCVQTEASLMERSQDESTVSKTDMAAMKHFRFNEDWDSLRVGCFEHGLGNFLKSLSMVTTCIAVVLQFDYLVVRAINDLALQAVSHNRTAESNI